MSATPARVFDLPALPPVLPAFARAALGAGRRPRGGVELPAWTVRVPALVFDRAHAAAYHALCGWPANEPELALTYPQAVATPLYLNLMTRPGFPLPLLGLVHVRNRIESRRALRVDDCVDLAVSLGAAREVRAGLEVDLLTTCTQPGGDLLWQATMTVLSRTPKPPATADAPSPSPSPPSAAEAGAGLARYTTIEAPADIGRRYARLSQDYNPIHLHAASARLFGFPRAIAHGLWTKARVLADLVPALGGKAALVDVRFRQPLLLPGRASLRQRDTADGIDFALLDAGSGRIHLSGELVRRC